MRKLTAMLGLALGCVVSFSEIAHAGDSAWLRTASWSAFVGGQAADVVTTYRALPMGGGTCIEGNSGIYGSNPNLSRLVLTKAIIAAPVAAVTVWADKRGDHKAANISRFIFGAFGGTLAMWNTSQHCR
jgi:hypothetical protein